MIRCYVFALIASLLLVSPCEAAEKYFHGYRFTALVSSSPPCVEEVAPEGANLIQVREGQEYSIIVYNPLPVRVGAAVTVDGLNTIDGKRTTADRAQKWIIEPYSSVTISGWQTSDSSARRFFFTREGKSYANWKGKRDGRDYSANLGIIGVAYFWNSDELREALYPPQPFADGASDGDEELGASTKEEAPSSALEPRKRAGTGMGRTNRHTVTHVRFSYDTGMYNPTDALIITYEFGELDARPLPFEDPQPEYRYRRHYAPEM